MSTVKHLFVVVSVISLLFVYLISLVWPEASWAYIFIVPLIALGIYDVTQKHHTLLRLYPVVGHLRYVFESIRPEIQQYFVEDNLNGTPVNREFRSLIYERAKGARDTRPFGTQFDVYREGYEWVNHSIAPKKVMKEPCRITFGGKDCSQPYDSAIFNISAMSFGALSKHAIIALNRGAQIGGFSHNTGEGGLSPYHLQENGDLVWQIGTGYFSCRTSEGDFNPELFTKNACHPNVKMIEIKLSQGAKPGHGGILPAAKVTEEIAQIRNVNMGEDVVSPPAHTAFSTPIELLQFVQQLRTLSGGKPVGFKLSVGKTEEFFAICKAMVETGIKPDFITVDGGEGGTGAAPIEFTNSIGTPLREAVNIVYSALVGFGLKEEIRLIASGKAFSAFHIFRLLALGADTINSARGMMFALGCIQSRSCNTNKCPTGIATQDPSRYKALNIDIKGKRVASYQEKVVTNLREITAAVGLSSPKEIQAKDLNRRVSGTEIKTYEDIFPSLEKGCLLHEASVPESWKRVWSRAHASDW
jgi:glutamate synthase domain-containing protein 2|nr:FMN-binding glutamate synthase family protein [Thiomicrorhabdus arctica]